VRAVSVGGGGGKVGMLTYDNLGGTPLRIAARDPAHGGVIRGETSPRSRDFIINGKFLKESSNVWLKKAWLKVLGRKWLKKQEPAAHSSYRHRAA
jgi:hypothetical protein